jgi:acyl phosphate:glycerol-3-phosphate acyltransferase
MTKYIFLIIAYLIGSIPFSYILGKYLKKEDIRKHGSGNLGTTNAFRVFGKIIGISVLIFDTFKSGLFVFFIEYTDIFQVEMFPSLIYGALAVIGHIFPVWMKFKGGKGVASSFGVLVFYAPLLALAILPFFIATMLISKYVSLASCVATTLTFLSGLVLFILDVERFDLVFVIITGIMLILVLFKHRQNFVRIINGNENRVNFRKKT